MLTLAEWFSDIMLYLERWQIVFPGFYHPSSFHAVATNLLRAKLQCDVLGGFFTTVACWETGIKTSDGTVHIFQNTSLRLVFCCWSHMHTHASAQTDQGGIQGFRGTT